jgi:poly(A) polymerase/tRNA nucleotidyltransferase (CCA-adding enzyme)
MNKKFSIPKEISQLVKKIELQGFQAYIVGGCVRDLLANKKPKDWDITTNAKPEEIQKIFPKNYSDNKFGTIAVLTDSKDKTLQTIEITPFRTESKYTDKRRPDKIEWVETINEDLARRDFTINAMAIRIQKSKIKNQKDEAKIKSDELEVTDLFEGQKDLKNKIIRAVGNPKERFQEDALRLLRAVRMAAVMDFEIEKKTAQEIKNNASLLCFVSQERIRDEFLKIILANGFAKMTKQPGSIFKNIQGPARGIELLRKFGLLEFIIPELLESVDVGQNKHHIYDIYEHLLRSLNYAVKENYNVYVRLAALLHDIAKPRTKKGKGLNSTFYNHEVVGAKMTKKILERLKFSRKDIEKITKLVRYHLFYYNTGEVGESSVRRLMRNVGQENIDELLEVRMADRIGSGVPKAEPYKLRHLKYIMEKVSKDPISAKMLKINGNDIMEILKIQPGPKIGQILEILLAEVLENPELNKKEILVEKIKEIGKYPEQKLEELKSKAMKKVEKVEVKQDEMTKEKYWVS